MMQVMPRDQGAPQMKQNERHTPRDRSSNCVKGLWLVVHAALQHASHQARSMSLRRAVVQRVEHGFFKVRKRCGCGLDFEEVLQLFARLHSKPRRRMHKFHAAAATSYI